MPRPPKNKPVEPALAAAPPPVAPARVIDVDNFIRVRDSVYARLTTIQDLIKSFSVDYLRQTNLLLGQGTNLENIPDPGVLDNALGGLLPPPFPVAAAPPPVEEKKERKKRTHDPNAPKRPLTPYFLYMQTARPIIANDLGAEAPKGAVQEEGQRRWSVMDPEEKLGWNQAYQYNLRLYNARVQAYKRGNVAAKDMTDDEALRFAEQFGIAMPVGAAVEEPVANEQDAITEQLQGQRTADQEPNEEEPAPEVKTPRKPAAGGRKRKTATPAAEADTSKAAATPATDKKRKRTSKAAAELTEEPKKSGRKKTKSG